MYDIMGGLTNLGSHNNPLTPPPDGDEFPRSDCHQACYHRPESIWYCPPQRVSLYLVIPGEGMEPGGKACRKYF